MVESAEQELSSIGRRFDSQSGTAVSCIVSKYLHVCASVTKRCNLVLT